MKSRIIFTALAIGILSACNFQSCKEGANCVADVSGPTALPSPSPSPSPTASPTPIAPGVSCRIDYMILRPVDGISLQNNEEATLDLTPYQTVNNADGTISQVEVTRACNDPRISQVTWHSSSASVLFVSGGFNPTVRRYGVGASTISATLEGKVSNSILIRTP